MTSFISPHKIQEKFALFTSTALWPVYTHAHVTLFIHTSYGKMLMSRDADVRMFNGKL